MTNPDRAFEEIKHALAWLANCESGETMPIDTVLDTLMSLSDWGCDVSVGAMRYVIQDINDNLIRELRRQSRQVSE